MSDSNSKKIYQVRAASTADVLSIVDLALRVKGVLHFPPAQLEWMLKQEHSDFLTFLCFEETGNVKIKGFVIGKRKPTQIEILEIYSESEPLAQNETQAIHEVLIDAFIKVGRQEKLEGITTMTPGKDPALQEALLNTGFYRAKIIEAYYTDGGSAELWVRALSPPKTPLH
jgi:hypothetical protein